MTDVEHRLDPVVRLAPAKLNLSLSVAGRRRDGYHDVHSVMVPLALADRLSVAARSSGSDSLHVDGPPTGPDEDNLVLRAFAAAWAAVGGAGRTPALAARLEKRIPVAAGLGGGSSDAAAALDAALEAWGAELGDDERVVLAARLGSDVPFFLVAGPALVEGRGERVTALAGVRGAAGPAVLLVTPAVEISTRDVFAAFDRGGPATPQSSAATRLSSEHLAAELRSGLTPGDLLVRAGVLAVANDLSAAAAVVAPWLVSFRRALLRILGRPVGMSGSGPTHWALYPSEADAAAGAAAVRAAIRAGSLPSPGERPPTVIATMIAAGGRVERE